MKIYYIPTRIFVTLEFRAVSENRFIENVEWRERRFDKRRTTYND